MEAALKAIAAPHRRRILSLVRDGELSAGDIAAQFDVTRPAVSQHLNVLKEAGLVTERRNGTRRLYRARPEGLVPVKQFLEEFWDPRLEALSAKSSERRRRSMPTTSESTAVERELGIDASPEAVWEFLVDPEKATRWMGEKATFEPRPGGLYRVEVIPGNTAVGEFVELDRPRRLVFTWAGKQEATTRRSRRGRAPSRSSSSRTATARRSASGTTDCPTRAPHSRTPTAGIHLGRLAAAARGDDPGRDPWLDGPM